jgi:DNA-binding response OmpR family regulator
MTPKKVVLADDEAILGHLIKSKLERSGYVVVWKTDGVQALEAVRAEHPDAVVLDVMMPGLSGYEVLERVKADPELKTIPVVMLTAQSQQGDIRRGIQLGAADYITKPFLPAELLARIQRLFPKA